MAKLTGRDVMSRKQAIAQLRELNEAFDGPEGVAILAKCDGSVIETGTLLARKGTARIVGVTGTAVIHSNPHGAAEFEAEETVRLPGDGKPFPEKAYAEALLCARVQFEP